MHFETFLKRLIAYIRERVRSGELTERGLARLTGVSQPHIHHVLKGVRLLSPATADQILRLLRIDLFDLCSGEELEQAALRSGFLRPDLCRGIPVLEGLLGPGHPFPHGIRPGEIYPFLRSTVDALDDPVVARLAEDSNMVGAFRADDVVLLDRSVFKRRNPEIQGYYVLEYHGRTAVRHVVRASERLDLFIEPAVHAAVPEESLSLPGDNILDIVNAKVVWIGRNLEPIPVVKRST